MRLLFVSLLVLNLFFGAWNLEKRLSSGGSLQHTVWIIICLASAVICFLELRHQKKSSSSGMPALGSLENFLEGLRSQEAPTEASNEKKGLQRLDEPKGEGLKQVT